MVGNQVTPSFIRKRDLVLAFASCQTHELLVDNITNSFQVRDYVEQGDLTVCLFLSHLLLVQLCQVALYSCLQCIKLVIKCIHAGGNLHNLFLKGMDTLPQHLRHEIGHTQYLTCSLTECDRWQFKR